MRQAHAASSLVTEQEVEQWRSQAIVILQSPSAGSFFELTPLSRKDQPTETIEQVITRRGSTHRFARVPIPYEKLSTILEPGSKMGQMTQLEMPSAARWP